MCQEIPSHRCIDCGNKLFCSDCEQEFHLHPARQGHNVVVVGARGPPQPVLPRGHVQQRLSWLEGSGDSGQARPAVTTPRQEISTTENPERRIPPKPAPRLHRSHPPSSAREMNDLSTMSHQSFFASSIVQMMEGLSTNGEKVEACKKNLDQIKKAISKCDEELESGFDEVDDFESTHDFESLNQKKISLTKEKVQLQKYLKALNESRETNQMLPKPASQKPLVAEKTSPALLSDKTSAPNSPETMSSTDSGNFVTHPSNELSPQKTEAVLKKRRSPISWICESCTFQNSMTTNKCEMCYKTPQDPEYVYEDVKDEVAGAGAASSSARDTPEGSNVICDIAAEKQKAWEKFNKKESLRRQGIHVPDDFGEENQPGPSKEPGKDDYLL